MVVRACTRASASDDDGPVTTAATVTTPDGRQVELNGERRNHILEPTGRAERSDHLNDVLQAISRPDRQLSGNARDEVRLAVENVGPSRWLQVRVVFEAEPAFVVTAFASRRLRR